MLRVENLVVSYGHINALRGISFEVNQGEIISLIGANGAGKTTALMAVSNLVGKESGRISFMDQDITAMPSHKIVKMGICHVPEGRKIFPELTVYENMISGSFGNPNLGRERMDELVDEQFALFPRLRERRNQAGGTLSGGEQQMLAIARGLMMDPKIIMLDEPSLGLAPIVVEEIFELIQKIRDYGKTILLIEQNASMALSIANRGYVLENGTVTLTGLGRDLLSDREVQRAYLGA